MSTHPARVSYSEPFDTHSARTAALSMLGVWLARCRQRKALQELAQEGRLLADIGLDRQQALSEAGKPFWR